MPMLSEEDLILSKLIWPSDSGSDLQLRDVRNLLAADADQQYLRDWAGRLEVGRLLEECLDG